MTKKLTLALAAACFVAIAAAPTVRADELITNGPQINRGDLGWSASRNNMESAHYDRLIQSNPGFRHARMRKECGPITDPQLRADCLASFQQFEPNGYGSSMPPR